MAGDNKAKILRNAEKYVIQGKIPQAINEYLKVIKADPDDVLTLNTIGDLYLRQGNIPQATQFFREVAEAYARNNFLLKAIAVYKKILDADPRNAEIHGTLAGLYVRQGLHMDARTEYIRLGELLAGEGRARESVEAYLKVVELDPMCHAVQLKLAETFFSQGDKQHARQLFTLGAQAQAKSGDYKAAMRSFSRAIEIDPLDDESLRGFLEASAALGDASPALEQLKISTASAPEDVGLLALLGEAYMAAKQLETARDTFHIVVTQDSGYFPLYIALSAAYLEAGDLEQAASCLDTIVPVLITQRETERAVEAYKRILEVNPQHDLTLCKLEAMYSATNDQRRHLLTLQKLVKIYTDTRRPKEAIGKIETILQLDPDNLEYTRMHSKLYGQAFPDEPYRPPGTAGESRTLETNSAPLDAGGRPSDSPSRLAGSDLLEVDLLINYGMKEKALGLLRVMESQNPVDVEVRTRLLDLYREAGQNSQAGEQCLAIALINRNLHNEEAASKFLNEARRLSPIISDSPQSLALFAQEHGIPFEVPGNIPVTLEKGAPESLELDLSGDLSEIFFKDSADASAPAEIEETESEGEPEVEKYPLRDHHISPQMLQERLQEVDFYIRLGFQDEARAKLDELSGDFPDHPDLNLRIRQLEGGVPEEEQETPIALGPPEPVEVHEKESSVPIDSALFHDLKVELAGEMNRAGEASEDSAAEIFRRQMDGSIAGSRSDAAEGSRRLTGKQAVATGEAGEKSEELLPDEAEEAGGVRVSREDFETHFNLGVAYREMELLDDAIKEFQMAFEALSPQESPKDVIRCCGMLSICYLEKDMPRSTIRWCLKGLGVEDVSPHEAMALRYDMGKAHAQIGETQKALECFTFIFDLDPGYRDVAQRIDDLRAQS